MDHVLGAVQTESVVLTGGRDKVCHDDHGGGGGDDDDSDNHGVGVHVACTRTLTLAYIPPPPHSIVARSSCD